MSSEVVTLSPGMIATSWHTIFLEDGTEVKVYTDIELLYISIDHVEIMVHQREEIE